MTFSSKTYIYKHISWSDSSLLLALSRDPLKESIETLWTSTDVVCLS